MGGQEFSFFISGYQIECIFNDFVYCKVICNCKLLLILPNNYIISNSYSLSTFWLKKL